MKKYAVNISFTTISDKSSEELVQALYKLLQTFEITEINQHSLYTWLNSYTGKPLEFNADGSIKVEKFNIENMPTDLL